MLKQVIVSKLKEYFDIRELVCPHTYKQHGDTAWKLQYETPGQQWGDYDTLSVQQVGNFAWIGSDSNVLETKVAEADKLDGKHASDFALSSHTHSNYTPYESNTQTIPANTGKWIRIAESAHLSVGRNEGLFEVEYVVGGYHGRVSFRASSHYNNYYSVRIVKINGSHYHNSSIGVQTARVVFKSGVYSYEYAYVELYVKNYNTTSTMYVYTRMVDAIGWSLTTGDGSIPTGYTSKNLSLMLGYPIYSTDDTRTVVTPSSGYLTIDCRYMGKNSVATISSNTTLQIQRIPDGYSGIIMVFVTATSSISIGTCSREDGSTITYKYKTGNWTNLSTGHYLIAYQYLPDSSGTHKLYFSISTNYTTA